MRVSTAVRVASIIVVVKAVLIGVVCWRRAEMLYHPLHFGAASVVGFITVVAVAVGMTAAMYIAARRHAGDQEALIGSRHKQATGRSWC